MTKARFTHVASIKKSNLDEVRVQRVEHGGQPFIDIRIFTEVRGGDRVHTSKGFVITAKAIPALVEALQRAAETPAEGTQFARTPSSEKAA